MNEIFKKTEMKKLLRTIMAKKNSDVFFYDSKNGIVSDGKSIYKIDNIIFSCLSDKVDLGVSVGEVFPFSESVCK